MKIIEFFIAWRFIKYSESNKDISSQAKAVILSIACGIIFYIASVSIMNGYIYGIMRLSFEVRSFHATLQNIDSRSEAESYRQLFAADKRTIYTGLYRETGALLSTSKKSTVLAYFREVPETIFEEDSGFSNCIKLISGKKSILFNEIMISEKTAQKLDIKVNDNLFVSFMRNEDSGSLIIRKLKVSGLFSTGLSDYDEQFALIGNSTGNRLFDEDLSYNVFIKTNDYNKANEFTRDFTFNGILGLTDWQSENHNEITAVRFQKNVIAFIVILVLFVAALNILTTIHITTHEKSKDIGILKSMGLKPIQMILVFVINGVILALIGIIPGILIGLFIMHILNDFLVFLSNVINQLLEMAHSLSSLFIQTPKPELVEFFSSDFYLDKIYTSISFNELLFISIITIVFALTASFIPAMRAGYIRPNEVLNND